MSVIHDEDGRRLYKARGPDGEAAWVDHDELWRLQRGQQEELRRSHARRRRLVLLGLVGLVALALVLTVSWWRSDLAGSPDATAMPDAAGTKPGTYVNEPAAALELLEGDEDGAAGPPVPTAPSPTEQVAGAVRAWAAAWERQDLAAYLASYAASFEPSGGQTRAGWIGWRSTRLQAPASIRVKIEELEIVFGEGGLAEARFVQSYDSPDYSDVVRKRLELVEEDAGWRIVEERSTRP